MRNLKVRRPAVANLSYPGAENVLRQSIFGYLGHCAKRDFEGEVKAIIVPHGGYIYSGQTAAYAYKALKSLDLTKNWKVLLMGVSHKIPFIGAAVPNHGKWETPLGLIDTIDIRDEIGEKETITEVPNDGDEEYSLEVQVPFLQMIMEQFELYPLTMGSIRADFLARDLLEFCKRDDVVTVLSTNLSHDLDYEEAKKRDFETSEAICDLDIEKMTERGDACGRMGVLALMFVAKELGWKCKMLDYSNSGDTAGTKDNVTGYGSWVFYK